MVQDSYLKRKLEIFDILEEYKHFIIVWWRICNEEGDVRGPTV